MTVVCLICLLACGNIIGLNFRKSVDTTVGITNADGKGIGTRAYTALLPEYTGKSNSASSTYTTFTLL